MIPSMLILSRELKGNTGQNLHYPPYDDLFPGSETGQRDTTYIIPPMLMPSRVLKRKTGQNLNVLSPADPFSGAERKDRTKPT
jgi:hypothetical protein